MSLLVATDLDRTLVYSAGARRLGVDDAAVVPVEVRDGRPVSYMTVAAAELLCRLNRSATVVPVTTRIQEQYRRILLPGPPPQYAITANGAELLVDGVPDGAWSRQVSAMLRGGFPLDAVWEQVGHICHPEFTIMLRNADDLFCYAVVRPNQLPAGFVDDVSGWAAERGWRTSLQGRKLYWVPEVLTKSAAVREVAGRAEAGRILAAGDSLLDVDLLLAADSGIHPRHGELYEQGWSAPSVVRTAASGIAGGEEILRWFSAGTVSE